MRRLLGVLVGFLSLVGVGAAAAHYLYPPYNPGFLEFPVAVALHVFMGGAYLALGALQFVGRIRSRHPQYHRRMGRILVVVGLLVGSTGLFIGLFIPIAGWVERAYVSAFGMLFVVALAKGWAYARAGRFDLHREWMIRAFAIGLAAATQRLIVFPVLFLVLPEPTLDQIAVLAAVSFLVAFGSHSLLAEVWIRRTRRRSVLKAPVLETM